MRREETAIKFRHVGRPFESYLEAGSQKIFLHRGVKKKKLEFCFRNFALAAIQQCELEEAESRSQTTAGMKAALGEFVD